MKNWHQSIRGYFAGALLEEMKKNENIVVLVGDLGYAMLDKIRDTFPDRFTNCGASEQAMMGIATGLALKGKIPFVYSITNFLISRPFETIKLYIDGEKVPVRLVGSGLGTDYKHDGASHDMTGIEKVLDLFPNIEKLYPTTKEEVPNIVRDMVQINKPWFIGVRR